MIDPLHKLTETGVRLYDDLEANPERYERWYMKWGVLSLIAGITGLVGVLAWLYGIGRRIWQRALQYTRYTQTIAIAILLPIINRYFDKYPKSVYALLFVVSAAINWCGAWYGTKLFFWLVFQFVLLYLKFMLWFIGLLI